MRGSASQAAARDSSQTWPLIPPASEPEAERDIWDTVDQAPDSEGLPSFVDESGVHWRQQPDGSVDWWDAAERRWERFQE